MDLKLFQYIGDAVTKAINTFVQPAVSNLIFELKITALVGVTLYITLTGYAISTGTIESPFWTFVKQCLKIIVITFFALTADGYINGVMEAMDGFESGLSQILSQTLNPNSTHLSIYQVIDQSLGRGFEIVDQCFKHAGEARGRWNVGLALEWYIVGIVIGISAIYVTVLGGTTIIVAKFSLAVMFALGPLFIMFLMFPVTARFFESWFSQVMNYILTIVIMAVVMSFAIKIYDNFIEGADFFSKDSDINPIIVALQVCAMSGILGWIILQAGSMASGLAGGFSMAAMDIRQTIAPLSGAANVAKGIAKGVSGVFNALNPMIPKQDMKSDRMKTARFWNHLMKGNTSANPAYRQYIKENFGGNTWGKAKGGAIKK